jgi:hypothetical protein
MRTGQGKQAESDQNGETTKAKIARKTTFTPEDHNRLTDSIFHQRVSSTREIEW